MANSLIAAYKAIGGGWEIRYGIRRSINMAEVLDAAEPLPAPNAKANELNAEGNEPKADELPPIPTDELPPVPNE